MSSVEIIDFRPFEKNTLRGFLTVRTPSGWEIRDITVHQKNGQRWLGMPAKQYKKEDGETAWVPLIRMADKEKWEAFQKAVLAALDSFRPKEQEKPKKQDEDLPF